MALHPGLMFNGVSGLVWRQTCGPATCSAEDWEELLPGAAHAVALIWA